MAFKMRGFSGFKQKVDHQKDMEDTVAGPRVKGDTGPASKQAKSKVREQINQLESMIEETNQDMENGRISDADGRKKLTQLQRKLKQIRTGK
tara:strand:- start:188 stop:463 length:276 start_codon:yes stop_codon:yes gene_type:complete